VSDRALEITDVFFAERGRLWRVLKRIVGDGTVAEDLLQDLYLKVSTLRGRSNIADPRHYLVRAATNIAHDHHRRQRYAFTAFSEECLGIADPAPSQEVAYSDREALSIVMQALERLPLRTRRAFELHRFDERKMSDIAAELGISTSLVCSLIADAYVSVRSALVASGHFSPPQP